MSESRFGDLTTNPHLIDTQSLIDVLQRPGISDDEIVTAFVVAIANVESLVRKSPNDTPFINVGDVADYPLTSRITQLIEDAGHSGIDQGVTARAATVGVGALLGAVKNLEHMNNDLRARVQKLEER
ncbi:hypothetical protein [Rhodococcus qingshengii]|uniref:hypothetical protein n=1 Tax=Rhodococcus qingshengii TaxID=334542 RepID=UPI002AFE5C51|nr:hypothetical protein [Rhodococcus qingshengii]MEA1795147.1 hypothetical protein [Rhodococcus qingshengii]